MLRLSSLMPLCLVLMLQTASPPLMAGELSRQTLAGFSRDGVSLGQSPEAARTALEQGGFALQRANDEDGRQRQVYVYDRETGDGTRRVRLTVRDGVLESISHSVRRQGGGNALSEAEATAELERLANALGLPADSCRPRNKGGGVCTMKQASADYENQVKITVGLKSLSIDLDSRPVPAQQRVANERFVQAVRPAYACFADTDVDDPAALYQCLQGSAQIFAELRNQRVLRPTHRIINLRGPGGSCADLRRLYGISQRYAYAAFSSQAQYESLIREWRDGGSPVAADAVLPSCRTMAAAIELATGRPPAWSACAPSGGVTEDQFRTCIAGVAPVLARPRFGVPLPSCQQLLKAYVTGVAASLDGPPDAVASGLDCATVKTWARQWRGPVPAHLEPCDGFDAAAIETHMETCLRAVEPVFLALTDCEGARRRYEQRLSLVYGGRPDGYLPPTCSDVEPLLAKASALREQRQRELEERRRAFEERQRQIAEARRDHVNALREQMAQTYAATTEAVASRTSSREKAYQSTGTLPVDCPDPPEDLYCPPTLEEIRLAMMRRHGQKSGFAMVNGHLLHGHVSTALTVMGAMAGRPDFGRLGVELHYRDPELIHDCALDALTGDRYVCVFRLPIRHRYDALTDYYLDGWSGSAGIDFKNFMFDLLDGGSAVEDHAYEFRVGRDGVWLAAPTTAQQLEDIEARLDAIQSSLY